MRLRSRIAGVLAVLALVTAVTAGSVAAEEARGIAPTTESDGLPTLPDLPEGAVIEDGFIDFGNGLFLSIEPLSYSDCPSGWVCLFQDRDWSGRMLRYQECCSW